MTLPQPESARGAGGFRVVKAPPAHAGPFAGYPDLLTIGHMQEITQYMLTAFETPMKARKAVRRAKSIDAYLDAVNCAFDTLPLRASPGFCLNEIEF